MSKAYVLFQFNMSDPGNSASTFKMPLPQFWLMAARSS